MVLTEFERNFLLTKIKDQVDKLKIDGEHGSLKKTPTVEIDEDSVIVYTLIKGNEAVGKWSKISLLDENENLLFEENTNFEHEQGDRIMVKYIIKI